MQIIDTHCDALYKLQMNRRKVFYANERIQYNDSSLLDTNLERLKKGNVKVQFFAIFIDEEVPSDEKWQHALEQIDLFFTEVIGSNDTMKHITSWKDFELLADNEIGAVLTLEGADPFGNDLMKLRQLYRYGILSMGLTWNHANLCADGILEPRGGGLTTLGKKVVQLNNEHTIFTDVSHSTINGFWDIVELADHVIASHSNAKSICDHPRNLNDDQIKAIIEKDGLIHLAFYPPFLNVSEKAGINDIIQHIDYLCSLGAVEHIGFGSDFDGIDMKVSGLESSAQYEILINELLKYFKYEEVRGFASKNFLSKRPNE